MRTTTHNFNGGIPYLYVPRPWFGLLLAGALCLAGCMTPARPADMMSLMEDSASDRAMQTRLFETSNERELLSASAAVLQDLGFQIVDLSYDTGFLRSTKERSAREYGQEIGQFLVMAGTFTYLVVPTDLQQKISATLVLRPDNPEKNRYAVRVIFYRIIWKGSGYFAGTLIPPGAESMELIRSPEIYQQFFAKLAKAVFLEAHKI